MNFKYHITRICNTWLFCATIQPFYTRPKSNHGSDSTMNRFALIIIILTRFFRNPTQCFNIIIKSFVRYIMLCIELIISFEFGVVLFIYIYFFIWTLPLMWSGVSLAVKFVFCPFSRRNLLFCELGGGELNSRPAMALEEKTSRIIKW